MRKRKSERYSFSPRIMTSSYQNDRLSKMLMLLLSFMLTTSARLCYAKYFYSLSDVANSLQKFQSRAIFTSTVLIYRGGCRGHCRSRFAAPHLDRAASCQRSAPATATTSTSIPALTERNRHRQRISRVTSRVSPRAIVANRSLLRAGTRMGY